MKESKLNELLTPELYSEVLAQMKDELLILKEFQSQSSSKINCSSETLKELKKELKHTKRQIKFTKRSLLKEKKALVRTNNTLSNCSSNIVKLNKLFCSNEETYINRDEFTQINKKR